MPRILDLLNLGVDMVLCFFSLRLSNYKDHWRFAADSCVRGDWVSVDCYLKDARTDARLREFDDNGSRTLKPLTSAKPHASLPT